MGLVESPKYNEIKGYFEIAQFANNEWKLNNFTFGIGKKDNTCSNLIITNHIDYAENVIHLLTVNVSGTFELADDTLIYEQYKSVFGGMNETTKEVRKNIPRDITGDEVKAINALMILNAMNIYSEHNNVKFSLPNDDPFKM